MRQPPLIKTTAQIRREMELLEALEDIEVAIRTLKSDTESDVNPIDRHYHAMKCDLKPIEQTDDQFRVWTLIYAQLFSHYWLF
jgi:poly [ADP-ribose] polymerase